jgi:hypothetical protein
MSTAEEPRDWRAPLLRTYKLKPEGFADIRRRVIVVTLPIIVVALLIGGAGALAANPPSDVLGWVLIIGLLGPFFIGLIYYSLRRSLRQQEEGWLSYQLLLGDDVIIRKQAHLPDIQIKRDEVAGIEKAVNGTLVVKTSQLQKFIAVPGTLEGIEEVRQHLEQWQSVRQQTPKAARSVYSASLGMVLLALAAIAVTFLGTEKLIVIPIGTLTIVFLLWALIANARNPHLDERVKKGMWMVVIPMAAIAMKVIFLATAL